MKPAILALIAGTLASGQWAGSRVCGGCHGEIYRKYSSTPMALSSGSAASAPVPDGSFTANRGYSYTVAHRNGNLLLEFGAEIRELKYVVGSGAAARSYLLSVDDFLFEAPATYYSRLRAWAPSPGYERYNYPFLTRAIAPACLDCHATGVQAIAGTQNGYQPEPFAEGGVGCERCHGPGAAHAASAKAVDIVDPARLEPRRRDSVCAQCHLSGEIRIDRAGKSVRDFRAGEDLSGYTVAFVRAGSPDRKVTSHVENLAQSRCSRESAGRLWCGTCHDPHSTAPAVDKVAWFRSKCRTCHAADVCRRGPNCIECHMPKSAVRDADHVVYTDHSIPRNPITRHAAAPRSTALVPFGDASATGRDLGLAYAIVALREQNAVYSERAFELLRQHPDDAQALAYLADLYKTRGDDKTAETLFEREMAMDPSLSSAPMNVAAYRMARGDYKNAIPLFEKALRISPGLVLVRMDLAVALMHEGRGQEAAAVLRKALEFNPTSPDLRRLLQQAR